MILKDALTKINVPEVQFHILLQCYRLKEEHYPTSSPRLEMVDEGSYIQVYLPFGPLLSLWWFKGKVREHPTGCSCHYGYSKDDLPPAIGNLTCEVKSHAPLSSRSPT